MFTVTPKLIYLKEDLFNPNVGFGEVLLVLNYSGRTSAGVVAAGFLRFIITVRLPGCVPRRDLKKKKTAVSGNSQILHWDFCFCHFFVLVWTNASTSL